MTLPRNLLKLSLLSSLLLLAVYAEGAETGSRPVQIKIGTILASNESDQFDARLKPMERQLKVMKYRSYRLLKEDSQAVPWNDNATFEIRLTFFTKRASNAVSTRLASTTNYKHKNILRKSI